MVGTNDCASSGINMEDVQANMTCLLNTLKSTCQSVTVCSILPCLNSVHINNTIDTLNAELAVLTQEIDATYIDLTSAFMVNSHYNYSLYHDSVHLNSAGIKILAHELGLAPIRQHTWSKPNMSQLPNDGARVPSVDSQPKRRQMHHHGHTQTNNNRRHTNSSSLNSMYSGCYNCGEENHNQQSCFFQRRVECSTCHEYGHKAKHHH